MSFWTKKNQESSSNTEIKGDSEIKSDTIATAPSQAATPPNPGAQLNQAIPSSTTQPDNGFNKVRSALSVGTVIQGKLSFDTPVRIDGKLSGEVYSSKVLIVGETAQISANIEASSLVIMGKIKGSIKATEKVQICAGADVEATILSPSLIIESGAKFNGTSDMSAQGSQSVKPTTNIYSNENIDLEEMLDKAPKASLIAKKSANSEKEESKTETTAPVN